MTARYDELEVAIRSRGMRMTPQRVAILRILADDASHPTAEQVFDEIQQTFPTTSRATVYKTLEVLKDIGQLIELEFTDRGNRYDGMRVTPHAHAVCEQCGRIDDVEVPLDGLRRDAAVGSEFEIRSERVDFYGLCPDCQT